VDKGRGGLRAISRSVNKLNFTRLINNSVLAAVLITESVSTNNNWLLPTRNKSGNIVDNDGLAEDCAVKDVADGAVG